MIDHLVSKEVGWEPRKVAWPKIEDVHKASDKQVLEWYRFLPIAQNLEQLKIINAVMDEFVDRKTNPKGGNER